MRRPPPDAASCPDGDGIPPSILRLLKQRDQKAWLTLYQRHGDIFFGMVRHTLAGGREYRAEEIAQEVWAAAIEQIDSYCGEPFLKWMMKLARRFLDRERYRRRVGEVPLGHEPPDWSMNDAEVENVVALGQIVDCLLLLLKDKPRQVICMRYFENLSVADIAKALRISETTARRQLDRAHERLRSLASRALPALLPRGSTSPLTLTQGD